jgi:DNA processing protein
MSMKINRIVPDESNYLQIINHIANAPERLYYIGKLPEDRIPTVAIVGSRKPTTYGNEATYKLAYDLAKSGVIIMSGLALGVDAIAHRAALDAGGVTIAVLASGLMEITPRTHQNLAKEIIKKGGALISEYDPPKEARTYQFLERNRLISGLADMVIVTEAAHRSGSLSTANHGLSQGREVGAIPGSITSALSYGTNGLIKQGAHLIRDAADVLAIIAPDKLTESVEVFGQTPAEQAILTLLKEGVHDGDRLIQQSNLDPAAYFEAMTMMEIAGTIRSLGGNQWTIK